MGIIDSMLSIRVLIKPRRPANSPDTAEIGAGYFFFPTIKKSVIFLFFIFFEKYNLYLRCLREMTEYDRPFPITVVHDYI